MNKNARPALISMLVVALVSFAAFLDATYLSFTHYVGEGPVCSVITGCDEVLTSSYATIGVVPIALVGALYYLVLLVLSVAYLDVRKSVLVTLTTALSGAGVLVSLALVYLQVFVIEALCVYCLFSAISSVAIFVISIYAVRKLHGGTTYA